jgi:hypothetical protein
MHSSTFVCGYSWPHVFLNAVGPSECFILVVTLQAPVVQCGRGLDKNPPTPNLITFGDADGNASLAKVDNVCNATGGLLQRAMYEFTKLADFSNPDPNYWYRSPPARDSVTRFFYSAPRG